MPYPPDYGGVIDIYNRIRSLNEIGVEIILHCFQYGRQKSQELELLCREVHYYQRYSGIKYIIDPRPYIVITRSSPTLIDNLTHDQYPVLFEGIHTSYFINNPVLKNRVRILRTHNIEHDYYRGLYKVESSPFKKTFFFIEYKKLKRYEQNLPEDIIIAAISPGDTDYFSHRYQNTLNIPPFHPFDKLSCLTGRGKYILIHGDLSVPVNIHSTIYLVEKVLYQLPFQVIISGKDPAHKILNIGVRYSNISIRVNPDDQEMHELVRNAQINLIHSYQPHGIKLKLLTALFSGRHCLANPEAVRNSSLESLCHIGENTEQMKDLVYKLMEVPFTREDIQKRETILKVNYSNRENARKIYGII